MHKCQHCGRSFLNLPLHERRCAKWTPEQREKAWKMWQYRRADKNRKLGLPANHHLRVQREALEMDGKRVHLTTSCDMEVLKQVLVELLTNLKVEQ